MKCISFIAIGVVCFFLTVYSKPTGFEKISVAAKGITVEINSELELFHIMAYLGGARYLNNLNFEYKADIDTFFSPYKNNESVNFIKKVLDNYNGHMIINGLFEDENFDRDTSFLQFMSVENFGLPNTWINKRTIIDSLRKGIRSFADVSQFNKFADAHRDYYKRKVKEAADEISGLDIVKEFESFWGMKKDSYSVVITLLERDIHAYWFLSNNKSNCIFYLSPKYVVDNDAKFGNSAASNLNEGRMAAKDYIYYGAAHEIGHSFINPIISRYNDQVDRINFKYSTADPSNFNFLCESFLRSLTAYLLSKQGYDDFAQLVLQGEKQQGYIYNEIIVNLLKNYENNRNFYKSFEQYAPDFLAELSRKIGKK